MSVTGGGRRRRGGRGRNGGTFKGDSYNMSNQNVFTVLLFTVRLRISSQAWPPFLIVTRLFIDYSNCLAWKGAFIFKKLQEWVQQY